MNTSIKSGYSTKLILIVGLVIVGVVLIFAVRSMGGVEQGNPEALAARAEYVRAEAELYAAKGEYNKTLPEAVTAQGTHVIQWGFAIFVVVLSLGAGWLLFVTGFRFVTPAIASVVMVARGEYDRVQPKALPGGRPTNYIGRGVVADNLRKRGFVVVDSDQPAPDPVIVDASVYTPGGNGAGAGNGKPGNTGTSKGGRKQSVAGTVDFGAIFGAGKNPGTGQGKNK